MALDDELDKSSKTLADEVNDVLKNPRKGDYCFDEDPVFGLAGRIESGETTGDPILDFATVYFHLDPNYTSLLRRLDNTLKPRTPFLIVSEQTKDLFPIVVDERLAERKTETVHIYGMISGNVDFDVKKGAVVLKTDRYFVRKDGGNWQMQDGNVVLNYFSLHYLKLDSSNTADITTPGPDVILYAGPYIQILMRSFTPSDHDTNPDFGSANYLDTPVPESLHRERAEAEYVQSEFMGV